MSGIIPSVPVQPNNFDCGPFLLFYLQQFFQNPIQIFSSSLETDKAPIWSDSPREDTRENLYNKFKAFVIEQNQDVSEFPFVNHFRESEEDKLSFNNRDLSTVSQPRKIGSQLRSLSPDITAVQTKKNKCRGKKQRTIVSHETTSPQVPCKRTKSTLQNN